MKTPGQICVEINSEGVPVVQLCTRRDPDCALDLTNVRLQKPINQIATGTGYVCRRRHICLRQKRKGTKEIGSGFTFRNVAPIEQNVSGVGQRLTDSG